MTDTSPNTKQDATTSSQSRKIGVAQHIHYSTGSFGLQASAILTLSFLIYFYTTQVGLNAGLAGLALLIGRAWDAFTDPAMGGISDSIKTRFGRRRPWILIGAVPFAVFFVMLWIPPAGLSQMWLFVYLLVTYLLYSSAMTIITVPYLALGGEISGDYNQRTVVIAFRMITAGLGTYLGTIAPQFTAFFTSLAESATGFWQWLLLVNNGYFLTAVLFGLVTIVTLLWCGFMVKEPDHYKPTTRERVRIKSFFSALKNKNYFLLILCDILFGLFSAINVALAPFLFRFWFFRGNETAMNENYAMLMMPALLIGLPAMLFWLWAGRKWGKKNCIIAGFAGMTIFSALQFVMLDPAWPWMYYIWSACLGFSTFAMSLMVPSIIPDIVDENQLTEKVRNDGVFFGTYAFFQKLSGAVGVSISGLLIAALRFEGGAAGDVFQLRILSSFGISVVALLSLWFFTKFTLTRNRVEEIQNELLSRKQMETDADLGLEQA
jgi:Na+/melibiose symporter-like transporter